MGLRMFMEMVLDAFKWCMFCRWMDSTAPQTNTVIKFIDRADFVESRTGSVSCHVAVAMMCLQKQSKNKLIEAKVFHSATPSILCTATLRSILPVLQQDTEDA